MVNNGDVERVNTYHESSELIDRKDIAWKGYYEATERKHFSDPTLPGSKFTDPNVKTLEELLVLVKEQRSSLQGNDADKFIKAGANPHAFNDDFRYLRVAISGKLGILNSKDLPEDTVVTVERTKPGAPCNYVINVTEQPTVNYGTVILQEDEEANKTRFITAFPGEPTPVSRSKEKAEKVNSLEGQSFTVKEVREMLGHDINVNTRIVTSL